MAFCCGWQQRFLPRQPQRSPYSKLIANAAGVGVGVPSSSSCLCTALFFLDSCNCHRYSLSSWVPWKTSRGWRGTGHIPERREYLESSVHYQGDEEREWWSPSQVTTTALPPLRVRVCFASDKRSYRIALLLLKALCSLSAGRSGSLAPHRPMQNKRLEGLNCIFQAL